MKKVILIVLLLLLCSIAHAKTSERKAIKSNIREISKIKTGNIALKVKDVPVRGQSVQFGEVQVDGELHLAAGIIFTKEIDAATVNQTQNLRLLREENGFWVDVSPQGNVVRIMPK